MPYLIVLLYPLLIFISWNQHSFSPYTYVLIFGAIVPLFYFLKQDKKKWIQILVLFSILFLSNLALSAWMWSSVPTATFFTSLINALFQLIIIVPSLWVKQGPIQALVFIVSWLIGEYLSGQIGILAPYNNLYYALSSAPYLLQWIPITGVWMGSAIILLVNYSLFCIFEGRKLKPIISFMALPLIALTYSVVVYFIPEAPSNTTWKVGLYQTQQNYYLTDYQNDGSKVWDSYLAKLQTSDLDLILFNESAVINDGYLSRLNQSGSAQKVRAKLKQDNSKAMVLYGSIAFDPFRKEPGETIPSYVQEVQGSAYTTHNIAVGIDLNKVQYRMKEIFVPFQEQVPYEWMSKLRPFFNIQGIAGQTSYKEKGQQIIVHDKIKILPLLCYESLFPQIQSRWDAEDYNLLIILANEQWHNGTPVEGNFRNTVINALIHQKPVLRVSNKGVDGFIDAKGCIQWMGQAGKTDHLKTIAIKLD